MEYVGYAEKDDAVAVRGDLNAREFIAFWHRHGNVTAAMNVNVWDVVEELKAIVGADRAADLDRLTDPDVSSGRADLTRLRRARFALVCILD